MAGVTKDLAAQSRASYEKVAQAGAQQVQTGEQQLERQGQQTAQASQALQRVGEAEQQEAQFQQKQALEEQESKARIQDLAAQRGIKQSQLEWDQQKFEADWQQKQQAQALQWHKEQRETDKQIAEGIADQQKVYDDKRNKYHDQWVEIRESKNKLRHASNDTELLSNLAQIQAERLKDNQPAGEAIQNIMAGKATKRDVDLLSTALDAEAINLAVKQAIDIGEWHLAPSLQTSEEGKYFVGLLEQSQQLFNVMLERQTNALYPTGDMEMIQSYRKMHSDPEERDRRIVKSAALALKTYMEVRRIRGAEMARIEALQSIKMSEAQGFRSPMTTPPSQQQQHQQMQQRQPQRPPQGIQLPK